MFTNARHQGVAPMGLVVYHTKVSSDVPRWLILLEAPPFSEDDLPQYAYVFAERLPDVMTILGQWAEVLRSLASFELAAAELAMEEEDEDGDEDDTAPDQ